MGKSRVPLVPEGPERECGNSVSLLFVLCARGKRRRFVENAAASSGPWTGRPSTCSSIEGCFTAFRMKPRAKSNYSGCNLSGWYTIIHCVLASILLAYPHILPCLLASKCWSLIQVTLVRIFVLAIAVAIALVGFDGVIALPTCISTCTYGFVKVFLAAF